MLGERIREGGHLLWAEWEDAVRFAEARHTLFKTRQRVTGELVLGRWFWRTSKALERVQEPCS